MDSPQLPGGSLLLCGVNTYCTSYSPTAKGLRILADLYAWWSIFAVVIIVCFIWVQKRTEEEDHVMHKWLPLFRYHGGKLDHGIKNNMDARRIWMTILLCVAQLVVSEVSSCALSYSFAQYVVNNVHVQFCLWQILT